MAVHRAAQGFETSAPAYERARPSYPPEATADLVAQLGIGPARTVVDLAAGTGKLTRLLLPTGADVVAVEPLAGMRAQLHAAVPNVEVLEGTAEAIPLPDRAADAVVVGQAFHWFDGERALAEIHRVLRPGRGLGLMWNVRDRTVDWVRRLGELTEPYAGNVPRYRTGEWRRAFDTTGRFGPLEHRSYPFEHEVDADTMVERMSSISWIAVLPEPDRSRLLERVRALFDGMPRRFPVPYHTELWWCRAG
jgi:SAM-dependent methyltransferase